MSFSMFENRDRTIERLEKELKAAKRETKAKDRFFSSMSHEIRTPINTILGLNELMLRSGELPEEMLKNARNIEGSGKMLLAIINDILDFSKIEAGQMDIIEGEYDVGNLLNEIVGMIWAPAKEKGLQLYVEVDPSTPAHHIGDEVRIKQVLINILNNAVKYTKEGEVRLHLESEYTSDDEAVIIMTVSDTGMGIKKEALDHLFDAFVRVDEKKNQGIEGTGLGLAIVKQLVELMGGTITVNSIYMQGSIFTVRLPQKLADYEVSGDINITGLNKKSEFEDYVPSFRAPDARILIVDDNRLNAEVESKLLEETMMKIDIALSGAQALALSLRNYYDLIFLDHLMPQMDGIECLFELKKQEGGLNKSTPAIALTANAGSENVQLYRESGFDGYLAKPVSGAALEDILVRYLPRDKVTYTGAASAESGVLSTARGYMRMLPVAIATSSISDLPSGVMTGLGIDVIPFTIHTEGGSFSDHVETVSSELIAYMTQRGKHARSEPPTVEEYEQFFAQQMKKATQVLFIALGAAAGREYERASAAAQAFDNVTVFDSGCLSTCVGILTLAAYQLAGQGESVEAIVAKLTALKENLNCSFVIDTTYFLLQMGIFHPRFICLQNRSCFIRHCE